MAWELIIVDNGSTDGSDAAASAYAGRIERLKVIYMPRPGAAYAMNRGVAEAEGDRVLFVDADDVVSPNYVKAMFEALDRFDLVGARINFDRLNPGMPIRQVRQWDTLPVQAGYLPATLGAALGARRAVLVDLGGFTPEMPIVQDIDLCWRAQHAGYTLGLASDAVLHYRQRKEVRAVFRQARGYGHGHALLAERYSHFGVEPYRPRDALSTLRWIAGYTVRGMVTYPRRRQAFLAWRLAFDTGMMVGRLTRVSRAARG